MDVVFIFIAPGGIPKFLVNRIGQVNRFVDRTGKKKFDFYRHYTRAVELERRETIILLNSIKIGCTIRRIAFPYIILDERDIILVNYLYEFVLIAGAVLRA